MSTRSNIAIRLREEDRNKTFKSACGKNVKPNGAAFLNVYCHWDGYPEGVGHDLKERFDGASYEDALKFILEGDRSTVDTSYWGWRQEECPPRPKQTEHDCYQQEYLYILEEADGKMQVKTY